MLSEWVAKSDAGYAGLIVDAEEYLALGETEDRYELVNGVVVMSPSSTPTHWRFVREILRQIDAFCGPGKVEPYCEIDLLVASRIVFRPNLCVYARPPSTRAPYRLTEPPDVVVEIASPGNKAYDLKTKRDAYEKFGVKEYWSIDPWDPSDPPGLRVRAWRLERGEFLDAPVGEDALASHAITGFSLDLRPLREMAGR